MCRWESFFEVSQRGRCCVIRFVFSRNADSCQHAIGPGRISLAGSGTGKGIKNSGVGADPTERKVTIMPSYSNELRDAVLRRVLPPQNDSINKVAAEEGISGQTIRNWIKAREAGSTATDVSAQTEKWSSQDKFLSVIETAGMTETELAEYAGKKGLSADEINAWREACMNANGGSASETARLQRENRELERKLRSTERELARKEKVLAEVAALLVLGKKAGAVWGGQEAE